MKRTLSAARKSLQVAAGVIGLVSICYCNYFVYSKTIDLFYKCDNRREFSKDLGYYDPCSMKKRDGAAGDYGLALIVASPILLSLGMLAGKALASVAASPFILAETSLRKLEEK